MLEKWFPWTRHDKNPEQYIAELKKPVTSGKITQMQSIRDSPETKNDNTDREQILANQIETKPDTPVPISEAWIEPNPPNIGDMEKQLEFVHRLLAEINTAYSQHARNEKELETLKNHEVHEVHDRILGSDSWFTFITAPYQLRVGDLHYSINYKTTTGKLDKIVLNESDKSLTAFITNCTKVGQITLELPRLLIDSQSEDNIDSPFDIFVQYRQFTHKAVFAELYRNNNARILQIDLPHDPVAFFPHDLRIKMVGTKSIHS